MAKQAKDWVDVTSKEWYYETRDSIAESTIERNFKLNEVPKKRFEHTDVMVMKCGTENAIVEFEKTGDKLCALNFASYKGPGGGFMRGQYAQEEALCHLSNLYNVLESYRSVYNERLSRLNNGRYGEDFIYSPNILFARELNNIDNPIRCDVLTYAAPCMMRKAKTEDYYNIWRVRLINAIVYPAMHNVDTLILGAWGCGVFCNKPEFVAQVWENLMPHIDGLYKRVIYAIPDGKNYNPFNKTISYNRIGE